MNLTPSPQNFRFLPQAKSPLPKIDLAASIGRPAEQWSLPWGWSVRPKLVGTWQKALWNLLKLDYCNMKYMSMIFDKEAGGNAKTRDSNYPYLLPRIKWLRSNISRLVGQKAFGRLSQRICFDLDYHGSSLCHTSFHLPKMLSPTQLALFVLLSLLGFDVVPLLILSVLTILWCFFM